jgi:hypothetical protein
VDVRRNPRVCRAQFVYAGCGIQGSARVLESTGCRNPPMSARERCWS